MQNNKNNKRMTNLGNYALESIVREMTLVMNEYNELVYTTAKVVTELCSPKKKIKVMLERSHHGNRKWKRI